MEKKIRTRYSVRELQKMYEDGNKKPLEDVFRAWKGIKELPPEDYYSFFVLGGYHGEPFYGQGKTDPQYWGGYCNHGNVLFPTWHRVYVYRLEQALQTIVPDVMMPYWDETSKETLAKGIPWALTQDKIELDGEEIDNPLKSYRLQKQVNDDVKGDNKAYTKSAGYETVRYPLSGLVGTPKAKLKTKEHNEQFEGKDIVAILNNNVKAWLHGLNYGTSNYKDDPNNGLVTTEHPDPKNHGVYYLYERCLDAPNYTVFSNTVSAASYNQNSDSKTKVVALETPHNDMHLAVGGFDSAAFPSDSTEGEGPFQAGQLAEANGDMGENNTAALDPIFFFHHCHVDRMFWLWQVKNDQTDEFEIDTTSPGAITLPLTNSLTKPGQGPAVGQKDYEILTMDTPLVPFLKDLGDVNSHYTSKDCINIETQLGFTYSEGSLLDEVIEEDDDSQVHSKKLKISGINRNLFSGSFIIRAVAVVDKQVIYLGHESVLSRWNVAACANCLGHLEVEAYFDLNNLTDKQIKKAEFKIMIQHRNDELPDVNYTVNVVDHSAVPLT